jgi:hypothetical protein
MKLTIKWVATIVTILLLIVLFKETAPPAEKYRPVEISGRGNVVEVYTDLQWTTGQLTRALLLVLYAIVVTMGIWVTPERTWMGLYMERKKAEQKAKIAEAEAQITRLKKEAIQDSTNP